MSTIWPDHFPQGCPDRKPSLTKRLYRAAEAFPVQPNDDHLKSIAQRPDRKIRPGADPCECASLSCFGTIEGVLALGKRYRKKFEKAVVVAIDVTPDVGRAMQTFSEDHFSLWLKREHLENPAPLFSEVVR